MNQEKIVSVFRILERDAYFEFTPSLFVTRFLEKADKHRNAIFRSWLIKPQRGGSRLPKSLNRDHVKPYIRDLIVLLHKVKGVVDSYLFMEWMYHFIQVILERAC